MRVSVKIMSNKNLDRKGRWRNKTIVFRVSPEEYEQINQYAEISGLTKQDFLISNMLDKKIIVVGNPKVHKALKKYMHVICNELRRINDCSEINDEFKEFMNYVFGIYERMEK